MREIHITQGQFVLVDDADYDLLTEYKWHASKSGATFYAVRHLRPSTLGKQKMHHVVIGTPPKGMVVDHIDGNGLNNQRVNLRFVTVRENQQNQRLSKVKRHSNYPGVTLCNVNGWVRWVAGAKIDGIRKTIGYFINERSAYEAYCSATNTVPEGY